MEIVYSQWAKSKIAKKNSLKEWVFVNTALNALQTAFSAILPTGLCINWDEVN